MENEHELSYETLTRVYLGSYEHYKGVLAEVEHSKPGFELQGAKMWENVVLGRSYGADNVCSIRIAIDRLGELVYFSYVDENSWVVITIELEHKALTSDSIPSGIDGADFDPEGDILLLEKLLNDDITFPLPPKELHFKGFKVIKSYVFTDIKDGYHDSEGDIIYLKSLLINDTIPNLPPEVFFDHDPKSLNDEPDNDDLKSMIKVFDPEIHEKIISLTYVRLPFEDCHYFPLTFVIKIFLPFLTYLVNSLFLLSSGSEDTIFDPGISAYSFYSLEPVAYGSPMKIFPFFYFCLKDKRIRGESS
ncbi:hypothetical protein Tco_0599964 [Tanacetum coccineum]